MKCTENACGAGMHGKISEIIYFIYSKNMKNIFPCIPAPQAFSVHFSVKLCVFCAFRGYSKRGRGQKKFPQKKKKNIYKRFARARPKRGTKSFFRDTTPSRCIGFLPQCIFIIVDSSATANISEPISDTLVYSAI
ncbi:hypothetical protein McpCs1_09240 [Methanocorpusculaceae archaeon Cs1]|uniref:Uncharacterized protein n=1 Tax=Methanorbis rubei TaxID=3028300 RepID=A0AAE4MFX0_9EURY|nr:hypothetical protein [Methanocorpusculaceae archaeon Cs1]